MYYSLVKIIWYTMRPLYDMLKVHVIWWIILQHEIRAALCHIYLSFIFLTGYLST